MRRAFGLLLLLAAVAAAQSGTGWGNPPPAAIAGVGYSMPPALLRAAPGQIVSLMVYGLNYKQSAPFLAASLPLPTSLGGISVTLAQGANTFQVPLLSVRQVCDASPCAPLTVVTVQIPFEVFARCVPCAIVSIPGTLAVSQTGGPGGAVQVADLLFDQIHVPSTCDTTADPRSGIGACAKLVTHANGVIVDAQHPARPGEVLVMYAFGLGRATPELKTGAAAPSPGPVIAPEAFSLNFEIGTNLPPAPPNPPLTAAIHPLYAGAVPGFAGLYQVNFLVQFPGVVKDLPSCAGAGSNLTVTLYSINSFDGAGICVAP